jgi:hypothetical protein
VTKNIQTKKLLKTWQIAGFYFILVTIISMIASEILTLLWFLAANALPHTNTPGFVITIENIIFTIFVLWIGIKSGAFLIKRHFVLDNIEHFIKLATLFNIILQSIYLLRDIFLIELNAIPIQKELPFIFAARIINIVVFYYFTKRQFLKS